MPRIEKFEDILAWQKAKRLCLLVYRVFKNNRDYRFRDQIQAASVSIMNNIAEGFEKKGDKDFSKFLYISKGSCGEVRSMLYLAVELEYVSGKEFDEMFRATEEISRMLSGFIKSIKTF